jgi:hypothetical protein
MYLYILGTIYTQFSNISKFQKFPLNHKANACPTYIKNIGENFISFFVTPLKYTYKKIPLPITDGQLEMWSRLDSNPDLLSVGLRAPFHR